MLGLERTTGIKRLDTILLIQLDIVSRVPKPPRKSIPVAQYAQ